MSTLQSQHERTPHYRLPDATRLGRIRLQVADLGRSIAYYEQVLGLRALERTGHVATLGPQGNGRGLIELFERPGARPVPRGGQLGLYHFALLLPDRPSLGRFVGHLAARHVRPGMSDHLVSEAIYLTDPDGLGIEVYADRPQSTWRHENGELVMTTAPLDVESLLRAAGEESWTGMPGGTVVGHLHLFVDELARAAAFYEVGLGFDTTVWRYPGARFFSAGGYHHHLGTNTWATGAEPARDDEARLLEWELHLPTAADVTASLRNLAVAGIAAAPQSDGAVVRDPWGTAVRLTAPS